MLSGADVRATRHISRMKSAVVLPLRGSWY